MILLRLAFEPNFNYVSKTYLIYLIIYVYVYIIHSRLVSSVYRIERGLGNQWKWEIVFSIGSSKGEA